MMLRIANVCTLFKFKGKAPLSLARSDLIPHNNEISVTDFVNFKKNIIEYIASL